MVISTASNTIVISGGFGTASGNGGGAPNLALLRPKGR